MEVLTMANFKIIIYKVREFIPGSMVENIMESGEIIRWKVMVSSIFQMVDNT